MIWIYPEQLSLILKKPDKSIYVLFGDDPNFLKNSQLEILKKLSILFHIENFDIELNHNYDWNEIFNLCKTLSLFVQYKILSLHISQNYPINLLNKNILSLYSLIHNNLILILLIYTSSQYQQHKIWMKFLDKKSVIFINCMIPNYTRLQKWIINQSNYMKLTIEKSACQLLCYYYEGNYILLNQILQYLSLVYPDGNLNYLRVKKIITDSAFFVANHWIEAILIGNKNRAQRIFKKIIYINSDLIKLLMLIQKEILIIIQIKYKIMQQFSLHTLFKTYKIYTKNRRIVLSQAIKRLNLEQLHQSISLLSQIELQRHKDYKTLTKSNFEMLTEILCSNNRNFPNIKL